MPYQQPSNHAPVALVLVTPEIPANTGNIVRLCAAAAVPLHLVEPLGFSLSDRLVKKGRPGLLASLSVDDTPHLRVAGGSTPANTLFLSFGSGRALNL